MHDHLGHGSQVLHRFLTVTTAANRILRGGWHLSKTKHYKDILNPAGPNASNVATVFNLVKSMVGAGILTAPFLFRLNGVFLSLIICLGVGFSMFITASVLVTVADWYGVSTYEDTLAKIFGRAGAIVLDICTVFRGIGSLIAYMIIIKDVASGLLADAGLDASRPLVLAIVASVSMLPLSLLRRLNSLRYFTIFAILLMFGFAVGMLEELIRRSADSSSGWDGSRVRYFDVTTGIFRSVPLVMFALASHVNLFPIKAEMRDPSLPNVLHVIRISFFIACLLFTTVGLLGYLTFMSGIKGNIVLNYGDSGVAVAMRFAVGINIIIVYPLVCRPCVIAADYLLFHEGWASKILSAATCRQYHPTKFSPEAWSVNHDDAVVRHYFETTFFFLASYAIGAVVKDLSVVTGIVGALASSTIVMLLPGITFLYARRPPHIPVTDVLRAWTGFAHADTASHAPQVAGATTVDTKSGHDDSSARSTPGTPKANGAPNGNGNENGSSHGAVELASGKPMLPSASSDAEHVLLLPRAGGVNASSPGTPVETEKGSPRPVLVVAAASATATTAKSSQEEPLPHIEVHAASDGPAAIKTGGATASDAPILPRKRTRSQDDLATHSEATAHHHAAIWSEWEAEYEKRIIAILNPRGIPWLQCFGAWCLVCLAVIAAICGLVFTIEEASK